MERGTILLAAGGTGGHLFPAQALAHELAARGWQVHLATDERAGRYAGAFPAARIHRITSATISGKNPIALARTFLALWKGFRQSSAVIAEIAPKAVVGFGGYPTLPPLYAATRRGLPSVVHEQNAVMGRANRVLAARVDAIAGGFLKAAGAHADKIVETGNPVRPAAIEAASVSYKRSSGDAPFHLVVFGGSQGAQFFSHVLPQAVAQLTPGQRARLVVTQQARTEDQPGLTAAYADLGLSVEIAAFFEDLAQRIADAQLVICRSGASSVSELATIGRPAILVPYPHALDHDQAANAAAVAEAGGALIEPQSGLSAERLAGLIAGFMDDADRAAEMAAAARSAGKPDATALLADLVEAIAAGQSVGTFKQGAHP